MLIFKTPVYVESHCIMWKFFFLMWNIQSLFNLMYLHIRLFSSHLKRCGHFSLYWKGKVSERHRDSLLIPRKPGLGQESGPLPGSHVRGQNQLPESPLGSHPAFTPTLFLEWGTEPESEPRHHYVGCRHANWSLNHHSQYPLLPLIGCLIFHFRLFVFLYSIELVSFTIKCFTKILKWVFFFNYK